MDYFPRRRRTQKDGASVSTGPAVCPSKAGSHISPGEVSAKIRALHAAMGTDRPIIVRFSDDRAAILSADALEFIQVHGSIQ